MPVSSEACETQSLDRVPVLFDGTGEISVRDIEAIALGQATVVVPPSARARMAAASEVLDKFRRENRLVYGVTTGFGPLARSYVDGSLSGELQRNLVYHLASGTGDPLPPEEARSVAAARLATLVRGHSGVRLGVAELLAAMLNEGLAPVIPEKGSVGASGDLTPLSHLALALMGEGEILVQGAARHAGQVLTAHGLMPLTLDHKDGLALVNGTSATAGIAALNGVRARRLLAVAADASVLYTELLGGHRGAWHPLAGAVRGHPGQRVLHERLWEASGDSDRLTPLEDLPPRHDPELVRDQVRVEQPLPQDPYSMRCVPQLLGACLDMLDHHDRVIATELNAVTDNPLVFPDEHPVLLHAGNFFGQHGAFVSDSLTNAVIAMAGLAERQIARLTDPALNGELPAFLSPRQPGLHSGFMGAQVTASALLAEMRAKAAPVCIQSIPTNGNNQDVVPMGTIAARRAGDMLNDAARILSILCLAVTQAFELKGGFRPGHGFAQTSAALARHVRDHAPFLDADRPLSAEIGALAKVIREGGLRAKPFTSD